MMTRKWTTALRKRAMGYKGRALSQTAASEVKVHLIHGRPGCDLFFVLEIVERYQNLVALLEAHIIGLSFFLKDEH